MQRVAKAYLDSSDDEKSSSTARAREARLQRRRDRVNSKLSSTLQTSNEDNNDIKINSLTSAARDARKNRYGSGLNDISNTVRKEETILLKKDHHSSSLQYKQNRPLVVPDIQKPTISLSHSVSTTNTYTNRPSKATNLRSSDPNKNNPSARSKSVSSHRSDNSRTKTWSRSNDNTSTNVSDSDDDEGFKKSGTAIAREVRMNRSLANATNTKTATPINATNPNIQSKEIKPEPDRARRRGRSRTYRGGVHRAKNEDEGSGDDSTVISLGSIYRNGSSRPPSQSRINKPDNSKTMNSVKMSNEVNEVLQTKDSSKPISKEQNLSKPISIKQHSSNSESNLSTNLKARYVDNVEQEQKTITSTPKELSSTSIMPEQDKDHNQSSASGSNLVTRITVTKNPPSNTNTTNPSPPPQRKSNMIMSMDFDDAVPSAGSNEISLKEPKHEFKNNAPAEPIEKVATPHTVEPVVVQPSVVNYGHILTDFGSSVNENNDIGNDKDNGIGNDKDNDRGSASDLSVGNVQILKDLETKETTSTTNANILESKNQDNEVHEKVEGKNSTVTTTLPEISNAENALKNDLQIENKSRPDPTTNKTESIATSTIIANEKLVKEKDLLVSSQVIALPPPSPVRNIRDVLNPNHPTKIKMSEIDVNDITLTPPPPSMAEIKRSFSEDQNDWAELLDNVAQPKGTTGQIPAAKGQESLNTLKPDVKLSDTGIPRDASSKHTTKNNDNVEEKTKSMEAENHKRDSENDYLLEPTSTTTGFSSQIKDPDVPSQNSNTLISTVPLKQEKKIKQWDYTNSRWNQFEKDENLERDAKEASAKAILNAVEEAANRDILNSPNPDKTGESVMVLPIVEDEVDVENSFTSLDYEADLEKSTRARHYTDKNNEWKSRPVSSLLEKLTSAGISTDPEEEVDFEYNRLTSNGMSLDEPPSYRRVKEEKPWSKSLKRKVSSGVDKVRNIAGSGQTMPKVQKKSAHDLVREEALRMLNLADSVGTTSSSRRSSSVADKARQAKKNITEKIMQSISLGKTNNESEHSSDTDVVNNSRAMSIGDFSIDDDDSDDEEVDKYRSVGERVEVEEEDLTVLYDKNDLRQEKPASNWSSRFSGSTLQSTLFSTHMKGYRDIKQTPVSARGMMWATPQSDDVSISSSKLLREVNPTLPTFMHGFSFNSGETQPSHREPSRFKKAMNSIHDELSKVETQKFCALITFITLLIIGIVTVEVSRSRFSRTPELNQDSSNGK